MDVGSVIAESPDDIEMDESATDEKETQEARQRFVVFLPFSLCNSIFGVNKWYLLDLVGTCSYHHVVAMSIVQ